MVTSFKTVTVEGLHPSGAEESDTFGYCFRAAPDCHSAHQMSFLFLQQCARHIPKTMTCGQAPMLPAMSSIVYLNCINYISDYPSTAAGWFLAGRSPD